jgi:ankyrin repeat protein
MSFSQDQIKLFVLAAHGNLEAVREMLEAQPGLRDLKFEQFDENALEAAGHVGREDIANHLLDQGAPLQVFAAAMLGRTEDVRRFLETDSSLAQKRGVHGFSLMFHAALSGKTEIAELILHHGGSVDDAALHAAVMKGHLGMTQWLLPRTQNVNSPDYQGRTALAVALSMNRSDLADALRTAGGRG